MRWQLGRRSDNVVDRRGRGSGAVVGGGIGLGTLLLGLLVTLLGGDPSVVFNQGAPTGEYGSPYEQPVDPGSLENDPQADFVSVVLADTEDTWSEIFRQSGETYVEPKLVLFSGATETACGYGQAAMGPFYCPRDQTVYIDLSFYKDLQTRHQAPGDFAQAYVIAHEVGHHVQKLLGVSDQVRSLQSQVSEVEANQLSVRLELQADCFAGIWAHNAERSRQILEQGDIEEAINAASSIGDDRLQHESRGYVVPESFTHGSSEQRVRWFKRGIESGDPSQCNTFDVANP
ncbi:neutral zinc metallopeptidase [Oscillatoria sp. FACHB-1407]|uniref:KPN_02809 family neutral zinc metallopeptidase n=1 Tax=Oscillatoria sp. FACHB-1407 TaxID=2692847 RepID=UPI001681F665|nr:neutral zinc metallopeptidase [Oscillatoria sp. FACHB-1407]MBD2461527.1 neutral zinc metallopeptidase [Oscillatoria sp. FACHB-1407]